MILYYIIKIILMLLYISCIKLMAVMILLYLRINLRNI